MREGKHTLPEHKVIVTGASGCQHSYIKECQKSGGEVHMGKFDFKQSIQFHDKVH